jgi:hypothetical protein
LEEILNGNFDEFLVVSDDSMIDDDVPNSAVDLQNKDRFLKKSLRIERVAEEVKLVLKPHYNKKHVTKEEYKEILRKAVPKVSNLIFLRPPTQNQKTKK